MINMTARKILLVFGVVAILIFSTLTLIVQFSEKEAIPSSDAEIQDNYAYVSNNRGLAIYEILNGIDSRKIKRVEIERTAFGVSIDSDLLYVSGGFGIKIYDLSVDPENPTLIGEYNKVGGIQICINNSLAFLTFINGGLDIIDVQNPANPVLLSHFNLGKRDMDVEVVGSTIYLADPDRGLEVINGSNPSNPKIITTLSINGAWDIWRVDNLLYLGCHSNGVRIINITNPNAPNIISQYQTDGDVYALAGDDEVLYVGNFYGRIEVLNVSNPFLPSLLSITHDEFSSHGMYYDGTYAYLVGHHTQFSILKYEADSSEVVFYSIATTKSARWDFLITIPSLVALITVIKKRKNKIR